MNHDIIMMFHGKLLNQQGVTGEKYDTPIMIPNIPDFDHLKLEALKNYRMYRGKTMVSGHDVPWVQSVGKNHDSVIQCSPLYCPVSCRLT